MESEQHEESKDSSEESDRTEATNDETGTGRFYECMFCKRGFSTAQALGGHMNIHRRDRARIRQQTLPPLSNRPADDVGNSGFMLQHQLLADHQPHHLSASEALRNYHVYLPPSTCTTRCTQTFFPDNSTARGHRIFGKDFSEGPRSTQLEPMSIKDGEEKNGEFDLELRLGYEP